MTANATSVHVCRCQLKCEKLEEEKRELTTRLSVLENEKKDIAEYLKRALLEKEEEADELRESLEGQRQAADEDRDARQLLHNQLTQQLQNRVNELVRENGTLGEECNIRSVSCVLCFHCPSSTGRYVSSSCAIQVFSQLDFAQK